MSPIEQALRECEAALAEYIKLGDMHFPSAAPYQWQANDDKLRAAHAAALSALEAPQPVGVSEAAPAGWKLVPVEPNKTMRRNGGAALASYSGGWNQTASAVYRAMLAAAPSAPTPSPDA